MSSDSSPRAVLASPLPAACFFRFFDGGLSDSPPAAFVAFASGSRAAKKAAVSSSRSTAA
jgi:hypothetical protein